MLRRITPPLGVALIAITAACDEDASNSCEVDNPDLSMVAIVEDNGTAIRAEADFERGDRTTVPSPLTLCDGDVLRIQGKEPIETEKSERTVYSVTLDADEERSVTFALTREDIGEDIEFTVDLPPAFTITSPEAMQEVPLAEALSITWDPPDPEDEMRVKLEEDVGYGQCVITPMDEELNLERRGGVAVEDDGEWTVPAGTITSESMAPCRAFYILRRIALRPYPDSLSPGGFFEARVLRAVEILAIP